MEDKLSKLFLTEALQKKARTAPSCLPGMNTFCDVLSREDIGERILAYVWVWEFIRMCRAEKAVFEAYWRLRKWFLEDYRGFIRLLNDCRKTRSPHWTSSYDYGAVEFHGSGCICRVCRMSARHCSDKVAIMFFREARLLCPGREVHPWRCRCTRCKTRSDIKNRSFMEATSGIQFNACIIIPAVPTNACSDLQVIGTHSSFGAKSSVSAY